MGIDKYERPTTKVTTLVGEIQQRCNVIFIVVCLVAMKSCVSIAVGLGIIAGEDLAPLP